MLKIFKVLVFTGKFVYFVVQTIGLEPFIKAFEKSKPKKVNKDEQT